MSAEAGLGLVCVCPATLSVALQAPREPRLLSVTVNSTTDQLLLLLSSGEVCCVQAQGRRTRTTVVVRLADFSLRYRLPEARKTDLQLFTIHTYYGIFCKGEIRSSYPLSMSVVSVVSVVLWLVQAV